MDMDGSLGRKRAPQRDQLCACDSKRIAVGRLSNEILAVAFDGLGDHGLHLLQSGSFGRRSMTSVACQVLDHPMDHLHDQWHVAMAGVANDNLVHDSLVKARWFLVARGV